MIILGIGRRLRESREKAGLTQEQLGHLVGVTGSAISNYEMEVSHPKANILYELMGALQIEPNFLFQDCVSPVQKEAVSLELSEAALQVAKDFDRLSAHGKGAVRILLDYEGGGKASKPIR